MSTLQYEKIQLLKKNIEKATYIVKDKQTDEIMILKEIKGTNDIYTNLVEIKHKNLQEVYNVFFECGNTYLACEYVLGSSLEEVIEQRKLNYKEVKNYVFLLCDAVTALHANKNPIIHRDIKLSNIIVSENFGLKLVDYDTVRTYKQDGVVDTTLLGTQGYAAPEQYGFAQTTEQTDVYAIGMVLYKMLTGVNSEYNNNYNGKYKSIVKKCLRLDPAKRFKSVNSIKRAFNNKARYTVITFSCILIIFAMFILRISTNSEYNTHLDLQGGWSAYEYIDGDISGFNYVFFLDDKIFNTFFLDESPATVRFGYYSIIEDLFLFQYVYLDPVTLEPLTWIIQESEGFVEVSGTNEILFLSLDSRSEDNIRAYFRDTVFPQELFIDVINLLNELNIF